MNAIFELTGFSRQPLENGEPALEFITCWLKSVTIYGTGTIEEQMKHETGLLFHLISILSQRMQMYREQTVEKAKTLMCHQGTECDWRGTTKSDLICLSHSDIKSWRETRETNSAPPNLPLHDPTLPSPAWNGERPPSTTPVTRHWCALPLIQAQDTLLFIYCRFKSIVEVIDIPPQAGVTWHSTFTSTHLASKSIVWTCSM